MLTLALLLTGFSGAWADQVTFIERSWDATKKEVVAKERTEDCQILSGNDNNWVGLGERSKTTYYCVKDSTKHKMLVIFGEVHLILNNTLKVVHIKLEAKQDAKLHIHVAKDANNGQLIVECGRKFLKAAAIGGP